MEKPVVNYIGTPKKDGPCVRLRPVNHQNHVEGQFVSNRKEARTSTVLKWNKVTGEIETLNTIYRPLINTQNTPASVSTPTTSSETDGSEVLT